MEKCDICFLKFSSKSNLNRHKKNIHGTVNINRKWPCSKCNLRFYKLIDLKSHLNNCHKKSINTENLYFETYSDFIQWKEGLEEETFSYFPIANSSSDNKGNTYERFTCQLHGRFRGFQGSTGRKWVKGPVKNNSICYASIIAKSMNKETNVHVTYTGSHSHPLSVRKIIHQPAPSSFLKKAKFLLALGVPANKVHDDLTKSSFLNAESDDNSTLTRKDLIPPKVVYNLNYKLKKNSRLHANENVALKLKIASMKKDIIIFKDKNSSAEIGPHNLPDLDPDSLILGYQAQCQVEAMKNGLDSMVFIDDTHGILITQSDEKFKLLNVLVKNLNRKIYPVAFFILSEASALNISACLLALKQNSGGFVPEVIMSDDSKAIYKAGREIYGDKVKMLLCHWHIFQSWRRKINALVKDAQARDNILDYLKMLATEESRDVFQILLSYFLSSYKSYSTVIDYLMENYLTPDRLPRWAAAYWVFPHTNSYTNMAAESFHSVLKKKYLNRMPKRRLDDLLDVFIRITRDYRRRNARLQVEMEFNACNEQIYIYKEGDDVLENDENDEINDEDVGAFKNKTGYDEGDIANQKDHEDDDDDSGRNDFDKEINFEIDSSMHGNCQEINTESDGVSNRKIIKYIQHDEADDDNDDDSRRNDFDKEINFEIDSSMHGNCQEINTESDGVSVRKIIKYIQHDEADDDNGDDSRRNDFDKEANFKIDSLGHGNFQEMNIESDSDIDAAIANYEEPTVVDDKKGYRDKAWDKIADHLSKIEQFLYDSDLDPIVEFIEGNLAMVANSCTDCKGIIDDSQLEDQNVRFNPIKRLASNIKLKKQKYKF